MDNPLRGLVKDLFIYGISDGVGKGLTFLALLLYTRFLSPDQNGVLNILTTGVSLLLAIQIVGNENAYIRFFMNANIPVERQRVTSTWLLFLIVWAGGLSLLLFPFSRAISSAIFSRPDYETSVILIIFIVPTLVINRICAQALRNEFRPLAVAVLNLLSVLLTLALSLYFGGGLHLGINGILEGNLAANILMLPIRFWTVRHLLRLDFSPGLLWKMLWFGGPLIPMEFAAWIFFNSDRFLVAKLSTLEQAGYYGLANVVAMIIQAVIAAFWQGWMLRATRTYDDDTVGSARQFGRVATYSLIGFGILCVTITVFAQEILVILTRPEYYPAAQAIGPLCLAGFAYSTTLFTALPILLTKKTHYLAICTAISAASNVVLNLIFIPKFGMMAASWSSVASYTLLTLSYLAISQRLWPIHYERWRVAVILALTLTFSLAAPLLPPIGTARELVVKIAYCVLFIVLLWVLRALDRREWALLQWLWQRVSVMSGKG